MSKTSKTPPWLKTSKRKSPEVTIEEIASLRKEKLGPSAELVKGPATQDLFKPIKFSNVSFFKAHIRQAENLLEEAKTVCDYDKYDVRFDQFIENLKQYEQDLHNPPETLEVDWYIRVTRTISSLRSCVIALVKKKDELVKKKDELAKKKDELVKKKDESVKKNELVKKDKLVKDKPVEKKTATSRSEPKAQTVPRHDRALKATKIPDEHPRTSSRTASFEGRPHSEASRLNNTEPSRNGSTRSTFQKQQSATHRDDEYAHSAKRSRYSQENGHSSAYPHRYSPSPYNSNGQPARPSYPPRRSPSPAQRFSARLSPARPRPSPVPRYPSPVRRYPSPLRQPASPARRFAPHRRPSSPPRRSPAHRSPSPARRFGSRRSPPATRSPVLVYRSSSPARFPSHQPQPYSPPRRAPAYRSPSPRFAARMRPPLSPPQRSQSPQGRPSPTRRFQSHLRRLLSPPQRSVSPPRRLISHSHRSFSPPQRLFSPQRPFSPPQRSVSPLQRSLLLRRRSILSLQRSISPRPRSVSPRRRSSPPYRSPSPTRRFVSYSRRSPSFPRSSPTFQGSRFAVETTRPRPFRPLMELAPIDQVPKEIFNVPRTPMASCYFCKRKHWSHLCVEVNTLEERQDFYATHGLCFNCGKDHGGKACPFTDNLCKWPHCGAVGEHHSSLCTEASYPITYDIVKDYLNYVARGRKVYFPKGR